MDMRSIFIANGVGIFILLMLHYTSQTRMLRHRAEDRIFSAMVGGVMLACCMEMLSYAIDGRVFVGSRVLNYAANTYLYSVNILLPFLLLLYVDLGLYGDTRRIRRHYRPQVAVGALMLAINVVNYFVPVSYFITEQNVYERRPLSYVYYVVIMYYCLTALVTTRRYERENGAKAFFNIGMFLAPIVLGSGLQFLFYGLSLAWLSAAVGLTGLFMMQQNEMAYIDALVDVYNRRYFDHVLQAWVSRGSKFVGAMVDVDRFKAINDSFGHSEGDQALRTVTGILCQARLNNEWVFRLAGDEFVVLCLADSADGLDAYLAEVNRLLRRHNRGAHPYRLALSYGTSFFESGSVDEFLRQMDDRMYQMKEAHHAARA